MYHYVESRGKKRYNYLVENIRAGGKWKKAKVYIGSGHIGRVRLQKLIKKNSAQLKMNEGRIRRETDLLYALLSGEQLEKIGQIKSLYAKSVSGRVKQVQQNYYEGFVTEFTYDTSAIEGSSVSLEETGMILFDKVLPKGKYISELREIENHKDAFDYMINYKGEINKQFVLKLHKLLTHNILWKHSGVFRDVQVIIRGSDFMPPKPEDVENEFKKLMNWYRLNKRRYNPVTVAAYFHFVFESVHPFMDGNGRVGRLLLNFILRKSMLPMINIKNSRKDDYYLALKEGNKGDVKPLATLVYKYLIESKIWV